MRGTVTARLEVPGVVVVSAGIAAVGIAGLGLAGSSLDAYIAVAIAGLGASSIFPDVMAYANGHYPRQVGAITGVLTMAAAMGSFLFQPLVGRVAESYGLSVSILGLAGCMALVAILYLPVWLGKVR